MAGIAHSPAAWRAKAVRVRSIAAAAGTAASTASESNTGISGTASRLGPIPSGARRGYISATVSGSDGKRRPPRPRIELVPGTASDTEAAAIVAALEQFLADTAPAPSPSDEQSPWQRAALEDGVAARQISGYAWGRPHLRR